MSSRHRLVEQIQTHVWKPNEPDEVFLYEEDTRLNVNESNCYDCGQEIIEGEISEKLEDDNNNYLCVNNVCKQCRKSRFERKEAIIELIETEVNYGQDLRILKEEFYVPMKNNSTCTQEEINKMFLNLQELVDVNSKLCVSLQDGLESCLDQDDNDFIHLELGEVFLNNVEFFEAYELFCSKQQQSFRTAGQFAEKIGTSQDFSYCIH